jgi:sialic acid synthase SpsE
LESHHAHDECLECPDCAAIFDTVSSFSDHFTKHEATRFAAASNAKAPEVLFLVDSPVLGQDSPTRLDDIDEFEDMAPTIDLEAHELDWQKRDQKERPFACDICDRSFTLASSLALHVRRHLGKLYYLSN